MITILSLVILQSEITALPFGTLGSWCASRDITLSLACDTYMIGFTDALIASADRTEGHSACPLTIADLRSRFEEAFASAEQDQFEEPARDVILSIMQMESGCSQAD